jgi:hypothetical protein
MSGSAISELRSLEKMELLGNRGLLSFGSLASAFGAESVVVERIRFDGRIHCKLDVSNGVFWEASVNVPNSPAISAIKMLVRTRDTIITNYIPLKLHLAQLTLFGKQVQIAIDRCKRDLRKAFADDPVNLLGAWMRMHLFDSAQHSLALTGQAMRLIMVDFGR